MDNNHIIFYNPEDLKIINELIFVGLSIRDRKLFFNKEIKEDQREYLRGACQLLESIYSQ